MCGRYSQAADLAKLAKRFGISRQAFFDLNPRYNLAPSEMAPAIVFERGEKQIEMMKWGLTRQWDKTRKPYFITNLTVEKLPKSPFKSDLTTRRCLIPADGFYEWKAVEKPLTAAGGPLPKRVPKQPFRFTMIDDSLFSFAGIYDEPDPEKGPPIRTFTIFTTEANPLVAPVHHLICTN